MADEQRFRNFLRASRTDVTLACNELGQVELYPASVLVGGTLVKAHRNSSPNDRQALMTLKGPTGTETKGEVALMTIRSVGQVWNCQECSKLLHP